MIELDHVVYVVENLSTPVAEIERKHGIVSLPGGVHPEGTAIRVVPLRQSRYLEFITAHDWEVCETNDVGRRVLSLMAQGGGFAWWGLRTDRIESLAERTGQPLMPGSIEDPDGTVRDLGPALDAADDHNGALPFFCQYAEDLRERENVWDERFERAAHPSGASAIAWIEVSIEEPVLRDWLNGASLSVRIVPGDEGIERVGLTSAHGEIVIGNDE
jgi:hypothetical protein